MKTAELRGDYSRAGPDYAVEQDWAAYGAEEHALYRRLFQRQAKLVPRYACPEWIEAIAGLDSAREIPRFADVSKKLRAKTGWEIVAVPGLIPDEAFFTHLAHRRFPVTVWLTGGSVLDIAVVSALAVVVILRHASNLRRLVRGEEHTLGRAVAPVPYLPTVVVAASTIGEFGSARQRDRWVRPAVSGELVLTAALSEELGDELTSTATLTDGRWRLSGVKTAVPATRQITIGSSPILLENQ